MSDSVGCERESCDAKEIQAPLFLGVLLAPRRAASCRDEAPLEVPGASEDQALKERAIAEVHESQVVEESFYSIVLIDLERSSLAT